MSFNKKNGTRPLYDYHPRIVDQAYKMLINEDHSEIFPVTY